MTSLARAAPYLLSWGVLAVLMIVGMDRMPTPLYVPIDGEWAKWNVEATLQFGKFLDLSPYSLLAGMGSMYFPNLPWLNPGALALGLPLGDHARTILSYAVYAVELAGSIVVLARALGFSWLTATAAAQLYLYLLFPPFSEVFRIYNWYSVAPYYAHLAAVLNCALALLLACGRSADWRTNLVLATGFLAAFIAALLSAPFTFVFATPAYIAIGGVLVAARRPARAEWAWKIAALASCLIFFFASGLLSYYLGTVATVARTPGAAIAWDQLLSPGAWLRLFGTHALCDDPRLILCIRDRGAWFEIAALVGAAMAIFTRRGDLRTVAVAFLGYIAFVHIYAYAYQAHWLGPVGVLSHHFLVLSCWPFIALFAAHAFLEPFRLLVLPPGAAAAASERRKLVHLALTIGVCVLLVVIFVGLLRNPYGAERYRAAQLLVAAASFAALLLGLTVVRFLCGKLYPIKTPVRGHDWRSIAALATFPILALVHLSIGVRTEMPVVRDASLRNYLRDHAAIALGGPFRGYATTIWIDPHGDISAGPRINTDTRYIYGRDYFLNRYGEAFTETDLWRLNVPTLEEYGEWTSVQAHRFVERLLAPAGLKAHSNYLRAYTIDSDILRLLGVRYVLTDADALDQPATLRGSVSAPSAPSVRLFELNRVNLGTYSPSQFVVATTADAIVQRIRDNQARLDRVAVVTDEVPATTVQARNVTMTVERDGVRIRAQADGSAHIVLPIQFSNCLVVADGAPVRLRRANLIQTLMSFSGAVDARIEFHFGLFADNSCRQRDARDNQALGL
jgi:hypothetical protein